MRKTIGEKVTGLIKTYERDLGRKPSAETIEGMRLTVIADMLADGEVEHDEPA